MRTRSLSTTEARVILALEAAREEEVSIEGIASLAGTRRGFARKLAHGLSTKGWLQRVGRGRYLLNPVRHGPDAIPDTDPLRFGSHLVRPYYFGFATAAELWGYLRQAGSVYYVVTPKRTSLRPKHMARFQFVRVREADFFGTRQLRRRGENLWVSDPERTLIDCVSRPELSGGPAGVAQVMARSKQAISWRRLSRYLQRTGNRSLAFRIGFLAEAVRPLAALPEAWTSRWLPKDGDPWVPLGPPRTYGRRGPHDPRWHIVRNIPERLLFAEVDRA
jgi:predicted transcriptional regulator of viral defense system